MPASSNAFFIALHARLSSVESIDLENSVSPIPTIAVLSFSIGIYLGKLSLLAILFFWIADDPPNIGIANISRTYLSISKSLT